MQKLWKRKRKACEKTMGQKMLSLSLSCSATWNVWWCDDVHCQNTPTPFSPTKINIWQRRRWGLECVEKKRGERGHQQKEHFNRTKPVKKKVTHKNNFLFIYVSPSFSCLALPPFSLTVGCPHTDWINRSHGVCWWSWKRAEKYYYFYY